MEIRLKKLELNNFKGIKSLSLHFGDNSMISGANATGKTTVFDAFCWLLFGKDSMGVEKFSIRPLDENGDLIHNVEISVEAVIESVEDGERYALKKKQKENWIKKRGSENPVLQGNVNEYSVNGYPQSEKQYRALIDNLAEESIFKMVTSPSFFPGMKWQDQRKTLIKFATNINDAELAASHEDYKILADELKIASTDDIKGKYQKALSGLKKTLEELPARIDELSKSKMNFDFDALGKEKERLLALLEERQKQQEACDSLTETANKKADEIMQLQFKLSDLKRAANAELNKAKGELESRIDESSRTYNDLCFRQKFLKLKAEEADQDLKGAKEKFEKAKIQYEKAVGMTMQDDMKCPYCKQEYPDSKKAEIMADFEESKSKEIQKAIDNGNAQKALVKRAEEHKEEILHQLAEVELHIKDASEQRTQLEAKLAELPSEVDVSGTDEYKAVQEQIAQLESSISHDESDDAKRREIANDIDSIHWQLNKIDKELANEGFNARIDQRVLELQSEQRDTSQKAANLERTLYTLEQFIKYKLDMVSDEINSKFEGINWKLFDLQINGGVKEVCSCTVNGVPYADLNNGHRIVAGLQIIKGLRKMLGISAPIFIDNAESVNDFNLPDMGCQMVRLIVTEEKELTIA